MSLWSVVEFVQDAGQKVSKFINKHRKKILWAAVIGGGAWMIVYLVKSKYRAIEQEMISQEFERSQTSRLQVYFVNAQKSSSSLLLKEIIPDLHQRIISLIEIPTKDDLKKSMSLPKEEKMKVWEKTKINSISRLMAAIYGTCLATIFLRIQVNILGRYMYMDTLSANEDEKPISVEVQQKFLSYSSSGYIKEDGLKKMISFISQHTEAELQSWNLTKKCSTSDIANLLQSIKKRTDQDLGNPNLDGSKYRDFLMQNLLVPNNQLQVLMNETRDVLDGKQFESIFNESIQVAFNFVSNQLNRYFASKTNIADTTNSTDESKIGDEASATGANSSEHLAKLLPIIVDQINLFWDVSDNGDTFIHNLFRSKTLEEFSYFVFTSSYDQE